ncbi:S9 family peptidase [Flexithrix dorotheae]|uniref:S9 family peptidase n=1 Tax=Flexithrix dorotheae TaxID=70993 RepID=UPI00039C9FAF|nr:S9 family peptidase [Flexithrix dorotheae]
MKTLLTLITSLSLIWTISTAIAQNTAKSTLTIEQIMQGPDFVGHLPENIFWGVDSKTIYFSWNPENEIANQLYKTDLSGNTPIKVSLDEEKALPGQFGNYDKNYSKRLYTKHGDIFLQDLSSNHTLQITNTFEAESEPQFSGNETKVYYKYQSNFFAWDVNDGSIQQLTNFINGNEEKENKLNEQQTWLEKDQLNYFQILRERKSQAEYQEEKQEKLSPDRPKKIFIGNKSLQDVSISPDGQFITYRLAIEPEERGNTGVMDYVTTSGYAKNLNARPKVGSEEATYEFSIYDRKKDTTYVVDIKQIPGIYDKPEFLKDYHPKDGDQPYKDQYENPREVVILSPIYSAENKAVVVIRALDNKDRWIMELELSTGKLNLLDRQRDEAWIAGPGISSWNFSMGNIGWFDSKTIWFQSEETGYAHIYTLDITSGKKKALTEGNFEILDAQLSQDKKSFYLTSNKISPAEQHFYQLSIKSGKMEQITSMPGKHEVSISPDEKKLAIRYSYSNKPWELYVMSNEKGAVATKVTNSTTAEFNQYSWREPEIIQFTAEDGEKVAARLYKPNEPKNNGPAVIFVHGAGYLQNVHKWWSSYYREYMFHNFLADQGYTVLDIDYRGSAGYGRDWRTGIYRFMGGKDLSDQIDGVKYLINEHGIDPEKVGIYGGSYGGFITLMALFTSPGTFQSGAALRSVTDWAHYNHGYTSNILNTPAADSIAYYRSSPIYHAENLEDKLVMLHGMIDTNVQFQDVVRLSQRLIELGKDDWELAVFPLEGHGFKEASSWADEYKRIFRLFEETLK